MSRNYSQTIACWLVLLFSTYTCLEAQQHGPSENRYAVVAGSFYPAGKQALESRLTDLFRKAAPVELDGVVQSLIVPHAGYDYSGIVAASGYKSIPRDHNYSNIFIIASSHREQFNGSSVYSVGDYITPLGVAKVNTEIANELIQKHKGVNYYKQAHDREHSIEVQVPFIQHHFNNPPPIIPIVMGSSSVSVSRDLATALLPYFTPDNLFIISSDFSHYPEYKEANRIDKLTGDAILKKDPQLFYNTLRKNSSEPVKNLSTPCCGWSSVLTMLYMAERSEEMKISPILYRNSGDVSIGDRERVVGYWSMAGYNKVSEPEQYVLTEADKNALIEISRSTLENYMKYDQIPAILERDLPDILKKEAGAFVSLYMGDRLRGCIGNFIASKPLYLIVQEMTLAAALNDQRFAPVEAPELEYINIEISVLTPLRKINSIEEFRIGQHGIYMTKDGKSGTYLPQVAEQTGWTAEEFLGHCAREKAGIGWEGWKEADLFVYEAIVFAEEKTK